MARDNGSRGSYRRTNTSEQKAQQQQRSPRTTEEANTSLLDEDVTPKAMPPSKNLDHTGWYATDHLADEALDLLNTRFPPMSVPGSMPRRQTKFFRNLGEQRAAYGWKDVIAATVLYGSAAVGFGVIMWDGAKAIGGYLAEAAANLIGDIMARSGA